jgi:SAM-dependent methyltransferase
MPTLRDMPKLFTRRALRDHAVGLQDRLRGLDFVRMVWPEEVGLDPNDANPSTPSGDRWLRDVFRDLRIRPQDSIIDIGCGKGSAMRVMLRFPFGRVDGIELSEQIAAIARSNFRRLRVPAERCRIHTANAAEFGDLDGYTYVYLSNPFSCSVMRRFVANVSASLARSPRPLSIIYDNPVCQDAVIATGQFSRVAQYPDAWGNAIAVFANRPAGSPAIRVPGRR